MTTPSDAMRVYRECRREIDTYSWPVAVYEFSLYNLPFSSDFWQPHVSGYVSSCELCSKDMIPERNPQSLIECCHVFCGECITKWFNSHTTPQCPTCSCYIVEEDDPRYCIACSSTRCYCEYDILCPVCHYTHTNMYDCVAQYNDTGLYTPTILERIEEGDETLCDSDTPILIK